MLGREEGSGLTCPNTGYVAIRFNLVLALVAARTSHSFDTVTAQNKGISLYVLWHMPQGQNEANLGGRVKQEHQSN